MYLCQDKLLYLLSALFFWNSTIFAAMKRAGLYTYTLLCLSVLILGCSSNSREWQKVGQAYSLLKENPDSSLVVLSSCNRQSFSEREQAFYGLTYYMAQDKSGVDVNSDSLLRYSYNYYSLHPDDSLSAKCTYYMGKYYSLVDSVKKAKDCYLSAIHQSEREGDLYTQYLSTEKLSRLLRVSNPEEAVTLAHKAYNLLCQYDSANYYNKVYLLINIGNGYNQLHKADSSRYYMLKALDNAVSSHDDELIGDSYHSVATSYLRNGQADSALFYVKKAWGTVQKKDFSLYSMLSSCYLAVDSLDSAKKVLLETIGNVEGSREKFILYNKLAKVGFEQNGDKETQAYMDSAIVHLQQLYLSSEKENVEYMKDNDVLSEKEELLSERQTLYIFAIVAGIIIVVMLIVLYDRQKRIAKEQLLYEQERAKLEILKHETAEERNLLLLKSREQQIGLFKKMVLSKIDFARKIEALREVETNTKLSEKDWYEIEIYLAEFAPGFMERLRTQHPNLKEKDIRFCMLLKLELNNQELLRFYERGLQAIKQRLLNLKTVLGIEGKNISTREYIRDIL